MKHIQHVPLCSNMDTKDGDDPYNNSNGILMNLDKESMPGIGICTTASIAECLHSGESPPNPNEVRSRCFFIFHFTAMTL